MKVSKDVYWLIIFMSAVCLICVHYMHATVTKVCFIISFWLTFSTRSSILEWQHSKPCQLSMSVMLEQKSSAFVTLYSIKG